MQENYRREILDSLRVYNEYHRSMNENLERIGLALSLRSPWFFRHVVRQELYSLCRDLRTGITDPEDVHRLSIEMLDKYSGVVRANQDCFDFPELAVSIKGRKMQPIGTAAGIDKNGDALEAFSYIFDFLTLGTELVNGRTGNNKPRVSVDDENENVYNAQGFPSEGKDYARGKVAKYRSSGAPQKPVILSYTGLPHVVMETGRASFVPSKNRVIIAETPTVIRFKEFAEIPSGEIEKALENAYGDAEVLLRELNPYVDGFEYNPFSPNTETLKFLRKPEIFESYARFVSPYANGRLTLIKMGPYKPEDRNKWLDLVDGWRSGGGDGITVVNTDMVPKEQVPSKEWGYPSAGKSGRHLKEYRLRAVSNARETFPGLIIFATGGIFDAADAYDTFRRGANAIEGYTPFTYYGLGLKRKLATGILKNLNRDGFKTLQELQDARPWLEKAA